MIACTGRLNGFTEDEYSFEGRSGVSRKVTLADSGETFTIKVKQECWDALPAAVKTTLRDFENHPNWRVTCKLDTSMRAYDPEFFAIDKYASGMSLQVVGASKTAA